MKKIYVSSLLVAMALGLSYCHTAKKASKASNASVTYEAHIQPIIMNSCAPCHIPAKGGNKEALDSYTGVQKNIDGILRRIQLNPTERGFMPARHEKLPDATIATIKQWKESGMAEK